MPNLTNLLKPNVSNVAGNGNGDGKKTEKVQGTFSLLGRNKDTSKKNNNLLQVPELKSPSRSPRIGLFRRCRHGKSSISLLKTGSQSCIVSGSSTSLSTCGSPLHLPSNSSSPRRLGGMPKCSTVANFNPVKSTVTTNQQPQKCCSLSTFAINNTDRQRHQFSSSSLQNSLMNMAASRCNSKLSCAMSRCCSNASFLPAPMSRESSAYQIGESSGNVALCRLCLCDHPPSEMVELQNCSCRYCRFCLQQYVFYQIMDGRVDIVCPDASCERRGAFTKEEIEHLSDSDMFQRYQRFLLNNEVDLDPTRTWCPRPSCETICNLSNGEGLSPTAVTCSTCGYIFCSMCKTRWHSNLTCDAYARQRARLSDFEEGLILSDDENASIKRCPTCKLLIERDDGCAQMMCKRCKHVFCWYCLTSLDDDFLLRHYDKGPCKNKLGHSRASIFWHRTQVVGIFAGFGLLLLMASPFLLLVAPCVLCSNCKSCESWSDEESTESPSSSSFSS